jgi:hypothetical protein
MSAPNPRGCGGNTSRGGFRGAANTAQSARGSTTRGRATRGAFRGARGVAAGTSTVATTPGAGNPHGLLQQMRTGAVTRGAASGNTVGSRGRHATQTAPVKGKGLTIIAGRGTTRASSTSTARGRGSGFVSKSFKQQDSPTTSRPSSPFGAGDSSSTGDVQQRYNAVCPSPLAGLGGPMKELLEKESVQAILTTNVFHAIA